MFTHLLFRETLQQMFTHVLSEILQNTYTLILYGRNTKHVWWSIRHIVWFNGLQTITCVICIACNVVTPLLCLVQDLEGLLHCFRSRKVPSAFFFRIHTMASIVAAAAVAAAAGAGVNLKKCQLCDETKPIEDMVDGTRCKPCNPLRQQIMKIKKDDAVFKQAFAECPISRCIGNSNKYWVQWIERTPDRAGYGQERGRISYVWGPDRDRVGAG